VWIARLEGRFVDSVGSEMQPVLLMKCIDIDIDIVDSVAGDICSTSVCTEQFSLQIDSLSYRIGWCIE